MNENICKIDNCHLTCCRFPWRLPASCFFHLSLKSFWLGPLKIVDSLVHVFLFFFFKFAGNTFSRAVLFELEHAKNYLESWWNHKFLEPVLGWPWCHWAKVHTGLYKNWCWASMAVQCLKTLPSHAGGVGLISDQGTKVPHASGPKNIKQKQYCSKFHKDFKNGPHQNKKRFKKELKDNCFTEFCCFLPNLNMNQP